MTPPAHTAIEATLDRLEETLSSLRAIRVDAATGRALADARARVEAQLRGEEEPVLTIAIAGCTGSGKSTLINALAGRAIARPGETRPTTHRATVYHHRRNPTAGLPADLLAEADLVAHDRPELLGKVIVDTPDLDTFATENRRATRALLKGAGLVLYLFSPERYYEERVWSVIREEERWSASVAVLNKTDTLAGKEMEGIADDVRARFRELGHPDVRILRVAAGRHAAGPDGAPPPDTALPADAVDEMAALRSLLDDELHHGEVARLVREGRRRAVEGLLRVVDGILPDGLDRALDEVTAEADRRVDAAATALHERLADRLTAVEADLAPVLVLRAHQRYVGPFRAWLAVIDFFQLGLPRFIQRLHASLVGESSHAGRVLGAGHAGAVEDRLRTEAHALGDTAYAAGLPVGHWQTLTASLDGGAFLQETARELEAAYDAAAADLLRGRRIGPMFVSALGIVLPLALVGWAVTALVREILGGNPAPGLGPLWLALAGSLLVLGALHGLVSLGGGGRPGGRDGVGARVVRDRVAATLRGRLDRLRDDLGADRRAIEEAAAEIRSTLEER